VLKALMEKADTILIGGTDGEHRFQAQGISIQTSRWRPTRVDLANGSTGAREKRD